MLFCQFDAYSRRLARGQGGVLRYVPAARSGDANAEDAQTSKKPETVLSPEGEIGRLVARIAVPAIAQPQAYGKAIACEPI